MNAITGKTVKGGKLTALALSIILMFTAGCDTGNRKIENSTTAIAIDTVFHSVNDSLEWVFNNTYFPVDERLSACNKLSFDLVYVDIDKSLHYSRLGLSLCEETKKDSLVSSFYRQLGMAYHLQEQYGTADMYYQKSLELALEKKDADIESFVYLAYGLMYSDMSQYEKSAEYYEKALKLCEERGFVRRYHSIILNIGITYQKMSNYELAEKYYHQAKEAFLENPYPTGLAHIYLNLGRLYYEQDRIEEAREASAESMQIFQSIGDKAGEALSFINMSALHAKNREYDKSLEAARQSLTLAEEVGYSYVIQNALEQLSDIYYNMGDYAQSEYYILRELSLKDTVAKAEFILLYQRLIPVYIQLSKKEEAIDALHKYDSITNEVNRTEVQNKYAERQIRYETGKKEYEIERQQHVISRQNMQRGLLAAAAGVLLLGLAAVLFFWRLTVQKKRVAEQRRQLAEKQRQLAEQQIIRLEQEKQLVATQALLDGETQERTRLARDLHDGLGSILTGTRLNLQEMKKDAAMSHETLTRYNAACDLLDQSIHEMRRIAHHLMPEALSTAGLKQATADFCRTIPHATFHYYGDDTRLDTNLEIVLYRIMHELVNNALKHAGATHILVQIVQGETAVTLTVQDDGCGFDPATPTAGTGLTNIRTRVAAYNGNLMVDTKPGAGTEINIELKTV
jgi:signal transduction histidine kinase